jgi:hypothetical protein
MALTLVYRGFDQVKGPFAGNPAATPYHIFRATFNVSGTYATGGAQFDLCTPFVGPAFVTGSSPQGARMGVTAISVNWVKAFGDYYDGTNSLTVADGQTALASGGALTSISAASTNNLATLKLYTGTPNGVGTAELTNATALSGDFSVLFAAQLTYGSTIGTM